MKRPPVVFLIACLLLGFTGALQAHADSSETPSLDVAEGLTLSGPPDLENLVRQYPRGVLIVDLRTAEEGVAEARVQAEAFGIRYENIPLQINAGAANADVVESLRPIVTKAPVQKALLDYSPEAAGHDDR